MTPTIPPLTPVAIIGMGCLFPGSRDLDGYWASILGKVDAIRPIPATHWNPRDYYNADPKTPDHTYAQRGGFLDPEDFPPLEFGITPNALEATDSTQLLGLLVARRALECAGYGVGGKALERSRASVILGVTGTLPLVIPLGARLGHPHWRRALQEAGVPAEQAEMVMAKIAEAYVPWQEDSFPGLLGNVVAGRIANRLDLHGTNCVVDAACASSLSAVHLGLLELAAGRSDLVLTGGMDTFNDIFMYLCFSKTPALSPTGDARPFAQNADGTILGEGLGCLVLKRLAEAERDGDHIHAVIRGMGTSSDGKGNAIYAPSPAGQVRSLRNAYQLADVTPDTIELIEAHGTGTRAGDRAEVQALVEVFSASPAPISGKPKAPVSSAPWCALGSVKSQIGHTKAAAGAAGLIKTVLALEHKVLPPTLKVEQPLELLQSEKAPLYVNGEARPWLPRAEHPRRAAVSSFGFGGSNYHCVIEEYRSEKSAITWDGTVQLAAFSGQSWDEVEQGALTWLARHGPKEWREAAVATRARFEGAQPERLVLVLARETGPERLRHAVEELGRHTGTGFWTHPTGACRGNGPVPGQLAFLFPGQGSQYPGMLRDLACRFPQVLQALAQADRCLSLAPGEGGTSGSLPPGGGGSGWGGTRLSDIIYPYRIFTEEQRRGAAERLRATQMAQPALGALSLGALRVLEHFGLKPDAVAGHSFGELTALHAAGRFSDDALLRLAALRGQLMGAQQGETGGMLAVTLGREEVQAVLRQQRLELVLANHNAPQQCVLSGRTSEIDRAARLFEQQGQACQRLPVSNAFHSPLVAGIRTAFAAALERVEWRPGAVPVQANTTGQPYPQDALQARALLARQLAEPVQFVELVRNLHRTGVHTFVEVGPGTVLSGLVRSILSGQAHQALALDASRGKQSGPLDLGRLLAALACLGYSVDLRRWDEGCPPPATRPKTLTVPICGASYRKPKEGIATARVPTPVSGQPQTLASPPPRPSTSSGEGDRPPAVALPVRDQKTPQTTSSLSTIVPAQPPMPTELHKMTSAPTQAQALQFTQESLLALQRLNEQTAQLHRQFLEGQERALQVLQTLLQQQQALLRGQPLVDAPRLVAADAYRNGHHPNQNGDHQGQNGDHSRHNGEHPGSEPRVALPRRTPAFLPPTVEETAAAPVPPPAPPPTAPVSTGVATSSQPILLAVVAEKTGYPAEMLELDMELDADLGIDSIKRVEIFSALQERLPNAPPIQAEHLGSLRTLRDVLTFLGAAPGHRPAPTAEAASSPPARQTAAIADLQGVLLAVISEKTGYPPEMLEPGMALDADLGIDSIKRVEIFSALQEQLPNAPAIQAEHLGQLQTLSDVLNFLAGATGEGEICSAEVAPKQQARLDPCPRREPRFLTEPQPAVECKALDPLRASALLEVIAEATGLTLEALELSLELDAPLNITPRHWSEITRALRACYPDLPTATENQLVQARSLQAALELLSGAVPRMLAVESRSPDPVAALMPAFERLVSVQSCPVLESHVINGRAVLPLALSADWLAQAALHANPGLQLLGLDDLRVCQGLKIDGNAKVTLQLLTGKLHREEGTFRVAAELRGAGDRGLHASATAILGNQLPSTPAAVSRPALAPYWREVSEVYNEILFHGPALQGLFSIEGCGPAGISAQARTAPPPAAWVQQPLRSAWLLDPLVLDCCLQMLSLWSYEQTGVVALPAFIASYRQFCRWPRGTVQIAAHITQPGEHRFTANVDIRDGNGGLIARLTGCESVAERSLNAAFQRRRLTAPVQ